MTGSDYLPSYNANQPNDCYIYAEDDSTGNHIYKLQYDENSGTLMAFVVRSDAFPFVLKEDLNSKISDLSYKITKYNTAKTISGQDIEGTYQDLGDGEYAFVFDTISHVDDDYFNVFGNDCAELLIRGMCGEQGHEEPVIGSGFIFKRLVITDSS